MATDILTPLVIKTKSSGDVSVKIDQTTPGTTNGVQINAALPTGFNIVGKVGIDQTTPGTTNGVQVVAALPVGANTIGSVGLNTGSNVVGKFTIDQTTPGTTNLVQVGGSLPAGANSIGTVVLGAGAASVGLVGLNSGSNLVGKFSIDQTTPGTTNGVQINAALPTGTNSIGNVGVNGTYNASIINIPVSLSTGQSAPLQVDNFGSLHTSTLDVLNYQSQILMTGGGSTTNNLNGQGVTTVQISGTFTGTISFVATIDNTSFFPVNAYPVGGGAPVTATTVIGQWRINTSGYSKVRVVGTAGGTGTSILTLESSVGSTAFDAPGYATGTPIYTNLNAGTNIVGKVGIDQTTPGTTNGVQVNAALPIGTNSIGNIGTVATVTTVTAVTAITNALPTGLNSLGTVGLNAGTNIVGNIRVDQTTPGTTNGVQITGPGASNGSPLFTSLASTSVGAVVGSPSFTQLTAGSAKVGQVAIDQTTPGTTNGVQVNAALPTGTNSIGNIATVAAVTAITNALPTGANSIGSVGLNAGVNTIGSVINAAGSALIGKVGFDQTTPGFTNGVQINAALPVGSNAIGSVTLGAGANTIGTVNAGTGFPVPTTNGTPSTTAITVQGTGVGGLVPVVNNSTYSAVNNLTPTAGNAITYQLNNQGVFGVQVSGTFTGTLVFEATTDGTNYFPINGVQSGSGTLVSGTTTTGQYRINTSGYYIVRVRCSITGTGTAVIGYVASALSNVITLAEPLPPGANSVGTIGLNVGSNIVGKFGIDQTTPGTTNGVQIIGALPAGANTIGSVSVSNFPGTQIVSGTVAVSALPALSTGTNSIGVVGLNTGSAIIGKVGIDQTTPGTTNGVQVVAALPTGANTIGNIGLIAGSAIVGNFRIDQTTAGTTNGIQITGPGTSSGNPIFVNAGAGSTGTLKTSGQVVSGAVAANGGTSTLTTAVVTTAKVGTLQHLVMSASAPMKWDIQTVNASAVATTIVSYFSSGAVLTVEFKPSVASEIATVAGDGTNVKFQVVVTNNDPTNAVSAYASFTWFEN